MNLLFSLEEIKDKPTNQDNAFMSGNTLGQKFTDNEILAVQQSNNKTRDSDTNRSKNRTKTVRRERHHVHCDRTSSSSVIRLSHSDY
eukprot:jgi/Picsp_1/4780/NSC_02148-R1_---NA---